MAKVIWIGEDTEDIPGPSFTTCYGLKFPKDVPVEVIDPDMVRRAKGNLMFKVLEEGKRQQEESHGESQTQSEVKEQTEIKEQKDKGTGYSPVKKKVRKKKPQAEDKSTDAATT